MNFYNVMRWLLTATEEERRALGELLVFIGAKEHLLGLIEEKERQTAPANSTAPEASDVLPLHVHFETGKRLKPGQYKMRVASATGGLKTVVKGVPPDDYAPQSPFAKRWWSRLRRASMPLSAEGLAKLAGSPTRGKEISTQLGTLFKRGLVTRTRAEGSRAYLYSFKEARFP